VTAGADDGVGGLPGLLGRDVADHHEAPFLTQALGGGGPDTGGCAGHDDDPSGQSAQSHAMTCLS
jgi:hypothetical protein